MDQNSSIRFDQGTIVLEDSLSDKLRAKQKEWALTWDSRSNNWRCDAICFPKLCHRLKGSVPWSVFQNATNWDEVSWPENQIHPPRQEQQVAIDSWLKERQGVISMPTGTGKTEVALHLMNRTSCSTLIVAPVRDLMYQWHRRIHQALGFDAGIIGNNTFRVRSVSVTTYDSAAIHMATFGDRFKFLIFDECHHLPGNFRRDAALMSLAPWRLGLSATPERSDGKHKDLHKLIGPTLYRLGIASVRGSTLADFEVIKIPVHLSELEQTRYNSFSEVVRTFMSEKRQEDSNFSWQDLCSAANKDPDSRNALSAFRQKQAIEDRATEKLRVIEDLFRLHAGTPIIVFAGSNAMARDISIRFLIPCLLNHCGKKERLEILDGLQDGTYPAVVANQVLDEGVDVPAVKIAIVVGGTTSTKQATQRLGRILRRSGSSNATLYEVVCQDTNESKRSSKRRKSDAYSGTRHRRL